MADNKSSEEITDISVSPAENGCLVRVSTKKPSKRKGLYDNFEYNNRTYLAPASLMETIMTAVGEEVSDGSDADKPKTKFNAKDFK